ncbi:hypothetical protein GW796_07065 [archaeon]|nr:hypothetical protein [archaeon]
MFIYESPDKGKTIYCRHFGELEKVIIKSPEDEITEEVIEILKEIKLKSFYFDKK